MSEWAPMSNAAVCRHCGRTIVRYSDLSGWRHFHGGQRYCKAATVAEPRTNARGDQ